MNARKYQYVGPQEIKKVALASGTGGYQIETKLTLLAWLESQEADVETNGTIVATFTISIDGNLFLAPRRSEHVACALGGPVLSAGEMTFETDGSVSEITNQSTGFCPEPTSWPVVAVALNRLGIAHPGEFTTKVLFRLCPSCKQRNLIKDDWYICALCGAELPEAWNFS